MKRRRPYQRPNRLSPPRTGSPSERRPPAPTNIRQCGGGGPAGSRSAGSCSRGPRARTAPSPAKFGGGVVKGVTDTRIYITYVGGRHNIFCLGQLTYVTVICTLHGFQVKRNRIFGHVVFSVFPDLRVAERWGVAKGEWCAKNVQKVASG